MGLYSWGVLSASLIATDVSAVTTLKLNKFNWSLSSGRLGLLKVGMTFCEAAAGVTEACAKVGSMQVTPELLNDEAAQGQLTSALSRLFV